MPQQELSDEPEEKKLKLVHNKKSVWKQGNCDAKTYQQMCQRSQIHFMLDNHVQEPLRLTVNYYQISSQLMRLTNKQ